MAFLQTTLPGQEAPPPCLHPQTDTPMGGACKACLWCFRNEAWNERPCFIDSICPIRQIKTPYAWDRDYEAWMMKARKTLRIEKLRAGQQRLLSEEPDDNPHIR